MREDKGETVGVPHGKESQKRRSRGRTCLCVFISDLVTNVGINIQKNCVY